MNRQNIIILTTDQITEAWGSLTEICRIHGFPYHTLKEREYPFIWHGWKFEKVPFRKRTN